MWTRKREQGSRGMFPQEDFKFKSSEMAVNASRTANSDRLLKFVIITSALKTTSYNLAPMLDQTLNDFEAKPNTPNGWVSPGYF